MNIAIYGSGGAGKEVYDLLQETPEERAKWEEIVFIDDTVPSGEYWGCRRFTFEDFRKEFTPDQARIVIAVGEPKARQDLYERVKAAGYALTPPILHRLAFVSDSARLEELRDFHDALVEAYLASGLAPNFTVSPITMRPSSTGTSPSSILMNVDLPVPLLPTMPIFSKREKL